MSVTRRLLLALSFVIAFAASALIPAAHADPIGFPPDWPFYEMQTEQTMCRAMAQGWSRAQIVGAMQQANNQSVTGLNPDQAAKRANMWVDLGRIKYCPGAVAS
ncbi:hypothetical protein BST44_25940 [Mycobacterium scrofulaceum]|uniref:DUF732 domain-containing protein n=1 Tax=Mycobacterium scrofulaceum TaxID=1783 RepID=A0A1X0K269_MYCSC|nr:hypothetical protein BST44_25940 [Mycobacterium scrofulaceum]